MGRVFTWSEIAENKIPTQADFEKVCCLIHQRLADCRGVWGAVIYGSAALGQFNCRSDIDCLVVYRAGEHREVVESLRHLHQLAALQNVPIEFVPVGQEVIASAGHSISLSLVEHLREAAVTGVVIKNDPTSLIATAHLDPVDDLAYYLRHKANRLEKGITEWPILDDIERCRFLQTVLETPTHVVRKLLQLKKIPLPDDSKAVVQKVFQSLDPTSATTDCFRTALAADRHYSDHIEQQLKDPDEDSYERRIRALGEVAWSTLQFIRGATRMIGENGHSPLPKVR